MKFQEELIEQATGLSDALGDSPNFVQAVLKVKNYQGMQLMHMILDSKVYTYMEERVIEQAIRLAWFGKTNFDGKFMETSTAYRFLYHYDLGQREDFENKLRADSYSFNRKVMRADMYNPHAASFTGFFTRMMALYNFELFILFLLISIYHMILIMLYMMIDDMKPVAAKYMMFMMTMNPEIITMDEIQKMKDMGTMFPNMWSYLLLS